MRSTKLGPAVAAAAALLALAPAGAALARDNVAAAHVKRARPSGGCRVKLSVAPRLITAGEPVLAYGTLTCHTPAPLTPQPVTLYQHSAGTPGYSIAGTGTTEEKTGLFKIEAKAIETNSSFYVLAGGARSAGKVAKVSAEVHLGGPTENSQIPTLKTGRPNKVTFSGTVTPGDIGATVVLQRQNAITGNNWSRIQLGTVVQGSVPGQGAFSLTHTFVVPGDANIRVLIRSNRRNVPSASNVLNYEISQAQNRHLTIVASADPISFGESASFTGVAESAPKAQMTLLARTAAQGAFAPVAQTTTDGEGKYAFPAQSPVDSTFYRVQGAGKTSAVLYEGVKDVLTAKVSASTIVANEKLTFEGSVTPDHTGHVIYLERANSSGTSFHVVETVTIGAGSSYKIEHTVYTPGSDVFRVKVPGDPQNGGSVSQSFPVTVTSAPAPPLTPEAPGNSTHPAEGQV